MSIDIHVYQNCRWTIICHVLEANLRSDKIVSCVLYAVVADCIFCCLNRMLLFIVWRCSLRRLYYSVRVDHFSRFNGDSYLQQVRLSISIAKNISWVSRPFISDFWHTPIQTSLYRFKAWRRTYQLQLKLEFDTKLGMYSPVSSPVMMSPNIEHWALSLNYFLKMQFYICLFTTELF